MKISHVILSIALLATAYDRVAAEGALPGRVFAEGEDVKAGAGLLAAFSTKFPSKTLFKRNDGLATIAPIANLDESLVGKKAIPTNKWWGNLIHTTTGDRGVRSTPAWANPYAIKLPVGDEGASGVQVCYSHSYQVMPAPEDGRVQFYQHDYHNDMTLSAKEFTVAPSYQVYDWSDTGVNVRICGGGDKCMDSALVSGMAFVSSTYNGLTPRLVTKWAITKFDEGEGKYVLSLSNGQTWVVYADTKLTLEADKLSVVAPGAYTGSVRVAVLPKDAAADAYDAYAGCTVKGGNVAVASRTEYSLKWNVEGESCASGFLHYALTHIVESMPKKEVAKDMTLHSTVRGPLTGLVVKDATWSMTEPELKTDIGFYPPRTIDKAMVADLGLVKTLKKDIADKWEINGKSYYFSGKAYQKYASLCLMANDEAIMGKDKTLLRTCLDKLEKMLDSFLTNSYGAPLAYDMTYRGIVTSTVFTTGDIGADFGNGIYNDHHYHYGYWVTASAMIKHLDPKWARMSELETMVTTLMRDVANPSPEDTYFPTFRHFSWYRGHSYSHGVSPIADGKDQESVSEDINFYYGMMLWGRVSGNKSVEDLGSLMLRVNARSVRTYFLMDSSNTIHPPAFVKNHVTGIFFDNKALYGTWFSPEKYCIHGIQMIPVSPINEIVRSTKFVQEEWDDILSKEKSVINKDMGNRWLSLLYANYAVVDKAVSLAVLQKVAMDDGLTRSWALYVAATRPSSSPTPAL